MADEFYRKFGDKCRLRREALREADLERCRLEAHALAGEAGLLDLAGISALASSIERLAGHGLEAGEAEDAVLDRVRGLLDRLLVSAIRAAEAGDEGGEAST
ncbi:MAG: Hpt domain-containing protein, partial [Deltaproteobacteria bacterium]